MLQRPEQSTDPEILQAALSYAARGWLIFPCDPRTKRPVTEHGLHDATKDENQIRAWWTRWPGAMIGMRTGPESGVWVTDLDVGEGVDGVSALERLAEDKEAIPETITTRTPRGGRHLFFKWVDGIRNSAGKISDGVDVRGEGGYVILPPSRRSDGKHYEAVIDCSEPSAAPQWLAKLVVTNKPEPNSAPDPELVAFAIAAAAHRHTGNSVGYGPAALTDECRSVTTATPGTRNHILNRAAFNLGQLVAGGVLGEGEVRLRLRDACTTNGLIKDDGAAAVAKTIESGLRAGMQQPRTPPARPAQDERRNQRANWGAAPPPPPGKRVELVHASAIEQRPIDWLWKPRLARGKIALIAGDPGVGKSSLIADIVARSSRAGVWPDTGFAPRGNCIILSAEDAADDTICPRLEVAGADMDRVLLMRMAGTPGTKLTFSLAQDLPLLAEAIDRLGDVVLLAIDPVTAYLGDKIDTHQTAAVRAVLEPLDAFAAHHRCAIFGVTHPPKATQSKAINAFTGSLAFVAASRTAFVAIEEPETDRRLLLAVKSNIGPTAPGIAYRLEPATTAKGIEAIRVRWDTEPVDITANEAIYAAGAESRAGGSRREAEKFLEAYLEAGPMPVDKVEAAAKANGISKRTLDRAKKEMRVVSERSTYDGGWTWRLPR
jgi:Bifunctional DNA primase/polymerase, N-terminal/AAA domain